MPDSSLQEANGMRETFPLLIRADANSRMGTGHIMRCLALGQAWLDAGRHTEVRGQGADVSLSSDLSPLTSVVFICAEVPDELAERLTSEGFGLMRIDAEPGSPEDLRKTLETIRRLTPDPCSLTPEPCLVLDGYHFNLAYQRGIRAAGCKLLLFDDCNHLPKYECDILLNQNITAFEMKYQINPDAQLLLGLDYILLRREFREVGRTTVQPALPVCRNLLVTMGGADPDNVSLKVIEALQQLNVPDLHVKVIVGSANPHRASMEAFLQHSTVDIQLIHSAKNMAEWMRWADLAISAAGSTCWELAVCGTPFVTVILADNQEGVAHHLQQQAGVFCFGRVGVDFSQRVADYLRGVCAHPARLAECRGRMAGMIDGDGAVRVLQCAMPQQMDNGRSE